MGYIEKHQHSGQKLRHPQHVGAAAADAAADAPAIAKAARERSALAVEMPSADAATPATLRCPQHSSADTVPALATAPAKLVAAAAAGASEQHDAAAAQARPAVAAGPRTQRPPAAVPVAAARPQFDLTVLAVAAAEAAATLPRGEALLEAAEWTAEHTDEEAETATVVLPRYLEDLRRPSCATKIRASNRRSIAKRPQP
mmetsp:Transcript_26331/g.87245  ORF Transcript_26331/g.87245 Transcript_26331/m.87245 type:complete len:200 (+) Transcript_26331:103-702(+)